MAVDGVGTGTAAATNGAFGTGATVFRAGVPTTPGVQVGTIPIQSGAWHRRSRVGVKIEVRGVPFRLPRRYSGVKLAEAFAISDLDREVKWHCRYARQNGIHVSPTFMVDGLVQTDMSSGGPVADWVARLLDH